MKPDDWKPWIELVEQSRVKETLDATPSKYKSVVAAALSVAKWDKRFRGELENCDNDGLCVLVMCNKCPLEINNNGCGESQSAYERWLKSPTNANRARMHALLIKIYKEEYEKVIK